QLLLDRIDWTADGWPVVNGGAGPSLTNVAPVTTPLFGDTFNASNGCVAPGNGDDLKENWRALSGNWQVNAGNCTTGGFAEQTLSSGQSLMVGLKAIPPGYRAGFDLRLTKAGTGGRYGGVVSYSHDNTFVAVFIDPTRRELVTIPYQHGQALQGEQTTPLP